MPTAGGRRSQRITNCQVKTFEEKYRALGAIKKKASKALLAKGQFFGQDHRVKKILDKKIWRTIK